MRVQVKRTNKAKKTREVKTVHTDAEANELLAKGWRLLHGGVSHTDGFGYQAKPTYILGLGIED